MSGQVAFSNTLQELHPGVDKTKVSDKDFDEVITALAEHFSLLGSPRKVIDHDT